MAALERVRSGLLIHNMEVPVVALLQFQKYLQLKFSDVEHYSMKVAGMLTALLQLCWRGQYLHTNLSVGLLKLVLVEESVITIVLTYSPYVAIKSFKQF